LIEIIYYAQIFKAGHNASLLTIISQSYWCY